HVIPQGEPRLPLWPLPLTTCLLPPGARGHLGRAAVLPWLSAPSPALPAWRDAASPLTGGYTATFTLPSVTQADAGTYGCSYRPQENPFVSPHPRSEVTLEVEPGAPRPSLLLHPHEEVALGDNVTFRCRIPRKGVWAVIYLRPGGLPLAASTPGGLRPQGPPPRQPPPPAAFTPGSLHPRGPPSAASTPSGLHPWRPPPPGTSPSSLHPQRPPPLAASAPRAFTPGGLHPRGPPSAASTHSGLHPWQPPPPGTSPPVASAPRDLPPVGLRPWGPPPPAASTPAASTGTDPTGVPRCNRDRQWEGKARRAG
uniref:Ig-like domain-containing protein n=1 Tax=Nothoprocta perdicaria TaxID=30464 RepID=A0A8C6YPQ2_NOTPE